jgi:hypothetical protein
MSVAAEDDPVAGLIRRDHVVDCRGRTERVARELSPPVSLGTNFTKITGDQVPDHGRSGLRALELSSTVLDGG